MTVINKHRLEHQRTASLDLIPITQEDYKPTSRQQSSVLDYKPYSVNRAVCRKNVSFKIFIVVILKEAIVDSPHKSFFWYDANYRFVLCSLHRVYCIGDAIPNEGLADPALGMKIAKIFEGAFLRHVT